MINTIWTNEDLKQIKKTFYSNFILKQESENTFTLNYKTNNPYFITELYNEKIKASIEKIFELTNKDEIDKIIRKYSNTKFDSNNRLHYGLISTLSSLNVPELNMDDSTYCTQIFVMLKEIISQYERIIKLVIDKFFNNITEPDEIKMYLNKIKKGELELDKEVLFLMQKVFSYTNGLNNEPIFKELITESNDKINSRIIIKVNALLANSVRINEIKKNIDAHNSKMESYRKYEISILETRKKHNGGNLRLKRG